MPAAIDAGSEGCYGPPAVVGRTGPAEGLDRAEEFAEPEGRAPEELAAEEPAPRELAAGEPAAVELAGARPPDGRAAEGLAAEALAAGAVAAGALDGAEACGLDRRPEAAVVDGLLRVAGAVAGPNVATDSMAPATRHTARMLASSGMTVPCPPKGAVILRSRVRRRRARSSRW